MLEKGNAFRLLGGKPEGKGALRKPRHRWVDNVKMNPGEIGWSGVDWIDLAQDRDQWRALMSAIMNPCFHKMLDNSLSSCTTDGFPRTQS
jgi:hypothetical protein